MMRMHVALRMIVPLLLLALAAPLGVAQDYPAREIRSICNFVPGSGADIECWGRYVKRAKIEPQ